MEREFIISQIDLELKSDKYAASPKIKEMLTKIRGKLLHGEKLNAPDLFSLNMQGIQY